MRMKPKQLRSIEYFLYALPFLGIMLVFYYYPLYGWFYAFFDYKPPYPIKVDDFVGFKWFFYMLGTSFRRVKLLRVIINTLAISGLSLAFSWIPMLMAILLNEIKGKRYRKIIQTITTIPNFISWVLVYAIAFSVLSSAGVVNVVLQKLGLTDAPILFLQSTDHVWLSMFLWGMWKNTGWNTIMYIAAISGIDEQLIEAARIDGASHLKVIWHITVPSLLPTYFVLLMINIANMLNNGMEQFYVFQNSFNTESIQVLDLYAYNLAVGSGGYSLSTAVSLFKSVISIVLLGITNIASKKIRGEGFL